MLSCIIIPKSRLLSNLHRKQAKPKAQAIVKQTITDSTHYIHTKWGSNKRLGCKSKPTGRVMLALNLDIESQGEAR
jgi:hypothetical protein